MSLRCCNDLDFRWAWQVGRYGKHHYFNEKLWIRNEAHARRILREELKRDRLETGTLILPPRQKLSLPKDLFQRLELRQDLTDRWGSLYELRFKEGCTPRRFSEKVGTFEISIEHGMNYIHSDLYYLCGVGIGFACYASLLKRHKTLRSSYHRSSSAAQCVWRKMMSVFPHKTDFVAPWVEARWARRNVAMIDVV